jgi:hypothetical protein
MPAGDGIAFTVRAFAGVSGGIGEQLTRAIDNRTDDKKAIVFNMATILALLRIVSGTAEIHGRSRGQILLHGTLLLRC